MCLPRSPEAVIGALAALKAGAGYLPLDPDYPAARQRYIVSNAKTRVAVTTAELRAATAAFGCHTIVVQHGGGARDPRARAGSERSTANGLAYVMYTSGSTGQPKGVQIEHRSIVRLVGDVDYVRLDESTCFLHAAPLGFDASTLELWGPLLHGGQVAIYTEPVPTGRGLAAMIANHGVNTAWLTAALFNAVVDEDPRDLRGLRQLLIGGEALSVQHVRRALAALPDTEIINGYGPTECTTFTTTYSIPRDLPAETTAMPIGRPIAETELYVLDGAKRPVAAGAEGELYVGGRGLARGYLSQPELNAEKFVTSPAAPGERLYRTGDIVRWLDSGDLAFVGRADQQVKIRGFRIELGEIEAALGSLPGVKACAVIARDDGGGKRLVAYVVPGDGAAVSPSALRDALAGSLPDFMVPAAFVKLDRLPLTANGKLDRAALPVPARTRPDLAQPYQAPTGALETAVCAAFGEVLGLPRVGALDGFFELGGDSLSALRVLARLRTTGVADVSTAQFFATPTPSLLARAVAGKSTTLARGAKQRKAPRAGAHEPIAIIGMAGRFPGAPDVESFWSMLCEGKEAIRRFGADELDPSIPAAVRGDSAYVMARGVLDDVEKFDAGFFGISPLEAQLMDPQHRHFVEVAWHALEHAGYVPETAPGPVGVFGGMYNATYLQRHLWPRPDVTARLGELPLMLANEKDYVTSRVAHKLGLSGPAVSVHTACSTSLVATVMAMDSLRTGACDMALAGGVAITCPPASGYLYQEGAMASPDGRTRAFDARAAGTVFSDGVGIVVLKRLSDAVAAGDRVYAVLLGGAINNDGSQRASFTAPSPDGQATVISAALDAAGVDARSISYIEAHGTATPLGDPIEIEGLTRAFRNHTDDTGFCAIGSLKSNVGHLVIAAGAASLIKTSLALSRRLLPPSINFTAPNPQIDFDRTPFRVQTALAPWTNGAGPLRAGVSSFGFGGTNAHVVLEEPPAAPPSPPSTRPAALLLLSARTPAALSAAAEQLAVFLRRAPADLDLHDVAYTLRVGRRSFAHRRFVVASSLTEASQLLADPAAAKAASRELPADLPEVGFVCPGQGAQYPGMGRGLYESEPAFRAAYDECCAILAELIGENPRDRFFASEGASLAQTSVTQPAIFALEYSLAQLWIGVGIAPKFLLGHSVGEFVCAVLAGVMPLRDGLALVLERGKLMQALPAGSMLSVRLAAAEIGSRLPQGVVIAAENSPGLCVASGPTDLVAKLERELNASGVTTRPLVTSHAFHSPMMDPAVEPMVARARKIELSAPRIPIMSTVTADWLSSGDARDPRYWGEHLRKPVLFGPAATRLLAEQRRVLIEVGPRATMSALVAQCAPAPRGRPVAVPSMADDATQESEAFARALGQLWTLGANVDWQAHSRDERRRRVALPGYPFERQRYWIEAPVAGIAAAQAGSAAGAVALPAAGAPPAAPASEPAEKRAAVARKDRLVADVREVVDEVSGIDISGSDPAVPWLELGLDSLTLTQLALAIQRRFPVKVTFRQVMEHFTSVAALAAMLDESLPADETAETATPETAPATSPAAPQPARAVTTNEDEPGTGQARYDVKKAFGAIARIHTRADELTPRQRTHLDRLVERYIRRTARSKAYTAEHRPHMADPRVVNGFRPLTKEIVYQIVMERSRGSHMWDIDGNEYVDVLSGFGMSLFGWQPDFIREAIHEQVDAGYEIGPQHVLAGEAAKLFCELTGAERVAFCNTGSEAVMGAMRIARTVTGRSTVAIFTGAYHGIFDEAVVRGTRKLRTIPAAPGILPESSQNMLVLDYGTPESLEILKQRADSLAAIVVEVVQSRRPDFRPLEFLRELRALTERSGTVLVFDEVVTGFRSHPAGVQGLFDIRADLATYGKVVGGGLPIGVIAGKRRFMDALDGGQWQYGDDSIPTVGVTYFAGTFVRHPLALAAAKAALEHMRDAGPALQEALTKRTGAMVEEINATMAELGAPFKLNTFASLWRNVFTEDLPYGDLIYAMLRDRGIHILDNFPCFLTTAHSDADVRQIVTAYREAALEMQEAGFFPVRTRTVQLPEKEGGVLVREVASTDPQREIWLADRLGAESSLAYNESISLHLDGDLEVSAFERGLRDLLRRHDALSATFSDDGLRLRVPVAPPEFVVPLVDLSTHAQPLEALQAICDRHVREPFDLSRGPLVRAQLVKLGPDHHVLVLTGHHIVLDGWSFWVLVKELAALYAIGLGSRTAPLEPAPSFVDYSAQLAQRAESEEVRRNIAWWTERFHDGGPVLALPTDRPRPKTRTQRADRYDHVLPAKLLADLKALGAARGSSLFATLLAGFTALLYRLTGQHDLVVGVPAAGQNSAGWQALVGHCVSTLPLRSNVDGRAPFATLVQACKGALLDAYDHQDVTLGRVLATLPIVRDASRLPLVSVLFNIDQALAAEAQAAPGVRLSLRSNPRCSETFELFINAVEENDGSMRVECQFNLDLFDRDTIVRWLGSFEKLLESATENPECAVSRLALVTDDDLRRLASFNDSSAHYPRGSRVEQLVAAQVAAAPQKVAVRAGNRSLTYREIGSRAAQIAGALGAAGIPAGARVGLLIERDELLVPAVLGTLCAGNCYVPLDPSFPAERLRYMVEDAGLRGLVSIGSLVDRLGSSAAGMPVVRLDKLPPAPPLEGPLPSHGTADDDAYVIYTSGSTGRPKGVRVPHRGVCNFLTSVAREPGMTSSNVLLAVTTLSFDIAVLELLLPLTVGAEIFVATREQASDGNELRALLERHGIDTMQATPATWRLLLEAGWRGGPGFKAICGGEALSRDLASELLPRVGELWNAYGPTETTVWSSFHRVERPESTIPIGRPAINTTLDVLDADGQLVPIGVVGELYIGGDGVTRGYLNRAELTAERFVPDRLRGAGNTSARLYRTGDLARWRNDGVLECLGRTDFQVKVRGYRIELGEIEAALVGHPSVAQATVTTREDRPGDLRLVGYFVVRPGRETPSDGELRAHLAVGLPEYMIPQRFVSLGSMPLTGSGKVDRKALPPPGDEIAASKSKILPRTQTETTIAAAFCEALSLREVGVDEDFFLLGGHSLLAAQMASRLSRTLDRTVPMRSIFEHSTVERLAANLGQSDALSPSVAQPKVARRSGRGPAPLSLMQQRVWYLEQLQLGRTVFNVPSAHRLDGALDVAALGRAFAELVQRQTALRTVIRAVDGEPVQVVLDSVDATIPLDDLSRLPPPERENELMSRITAEIARPFELREPPLFKVRLFRLDARQHVLFFMAHHAVFDGWSFDLLYAELSELYDAARTSRPAKLAPLSVDYADFATWHRTWMDGPELARQLAFWKHKLTGAPRMLDVPVDRPRPPIQSGDGATEWLRIDGEHAAALRALANREGATLYMVLLAAWSVLLARLSGQQEVVIGTPVRGRSLPELENIVGFFVNALPMRLRVDAKQSFLETLRHVRREVIDAFGHQDVPFEHLVRILDVSRDESRFPIYQAFFSYQDARQRPSFWGNLGHTNVPVFQPSAAQDLALWFLEDRTGLVGGLNYNTDIFNSGTAKLLRGRFGELLAEILKHADAPVHTLWGPTRDELEELKEWNDTASALPSAVTISELLGPALAAAGDKVAIRYGAKAITYAALRQESARFAAALRARGIGVGDVVGLHLSRTPTMLAALLGTLESGATYLPLDPAFPAERLKFMLEDSGARIVICDEASQPQSLASPNLLRVEELDAPAARRAPGQPASADWAGAPPGERPAYLIYTSGSTGKPKGVLVPHRAVVNFLLSMRKAPGLERTAKLAAVTTLSFDIAVLELLLPLAVGAEIVLATREQAADGHELRTLLEREKVDAMQATPSTWRLLIEAGWRGNGTFKALCGGEALSAELADELLQRTGQLWNMYGPTETTVWSTCARIEPGQGDVSIGLPIANTEVWVLDERGEPAPIGVAGEIYIGGAGVAVGYHARPDLTAERFVPDRLSGRPYARLYRTGDLGRWSSDGRLQCLGRTDFQVKVRGHRIELGEIETALARHGGIEQAVVVAAGDKGGDTRLVAYAVARGGVEPVAADLREHLRTELPAYMVPAQFVFLPRLPLTPNGKVDRKALPKPADAVGASAPLVAGAPRTDEEKLIAEIWGELLRVEQISVFDNFLDLGGHSLLIMRAIAKIETRAQVRLSPRIFIFQTLEQIAAELAQTQSAATAGAPPHDARSSGIVQRVVRVLQRMF